MHKLLTRKATLFWKYRLPEFSHLTTSIYIPNVNYIYILNSKPSKLFPFSMAFQSKTPKEPLPKNLKQAITFKHFREMKRCYVEWRLSVCVYTLQMFVCPIDCGSLSRLAAFIQVFWITDQQEHAQNVHTLLSWVCQTNIVLLFLTDISLAFLYTHKHIYVLYKYFTK